MCRFSEGPINLSVLGYLDWVIRYGVVDRINYRNEYSTFNTCDGFGISIGLLLGKVKIFGISLGTTWILFFGIFLGHIGLQVDENILHFLKEFGLILFIYSIGMQVGPSFFSSFKQGGITLNILASGVVLLGVLVTYIIHLVTGLPIATMVGILSGAVTNTPGLGAHSRPIPK